MNLRTLVKYNPFRELRSYAERDQQTFEQFRGAGKKSRGKFEKEASATLVSRQLERRYSDVVVHAFCRSHIANVLQVNRRQRHQQTVSATLTT